MQFPNRRLLGALGVSLLTFGAQHDTLAEIEVSPGPSNPAYPATEPDPWVITGPLDLMGSTLSIDNGSSVTADQLLNGGVILGSTSGSYTFADIGFDSGAFATFLDDATGNTATFSNTDNSVAYFGLSNGATFNNSAGGTIGGPGSTIVINLDSASSFLGTGNTVFGGDNSSFSLGPGVEPTLSATGSGDQATMVNEVTALVTIAKAKAADRAMNAITQFNLTAGDDLGNPDAPIPSGVGYTFKVDGDASFGGASSDALIFVDKDSSFEVTGNADFVSGGGSVVNILAIGGEFKVGETFSGIRGGISSITQFFAGSDVTIGGDWLYGNADGNGTSVSTFTAYNSTIMVGGHFDATLGEGSANEVTWDNVTYTGGGDFRVAGTDNTANGSAASLNINDSSLTTTGSIVSVLGNNSVQNHDIQNTIISLGGDYLAEIGGTGPDAGGSTQTVSFNDTGIAAQNLTTRITGDTNSQSATFDGVDFDLAGDFLFESTGGTSDSLLSMINTTGAIDGDFTARSTGDNIISTVVIGDFDVAVGQDIRFELPSTNNSSATLFLGDFKASVGGDVIFDMPTDATGSRTVTIGAFDIDFVGDGISHTLELADATLIDGGSGFTIDTTGTGSSTTVALTNVTGTVGGDFSVTGPQTDVSIINDNGGLLDIAGNMDFSAGPGSMLELNFTNGSDLSVGQNLIGLRNGTSSTTFNFSESTVSVGGDWLTGDAVPTIPGDVIGSSVQSFTADQSSFTIGGSFDAGMGPNAINGMTLTTVTMDINGDFTYASNGSAPGVVTTNSIATLTAADSSISANGGFHSVLGDASIQLIDFLRTDLSFGGDFFVEIGAFSGTTEYPEGGFSTQNVTMNTVALTANSLTIRDLGPNASGTYSFSDTTLAITNDWLIENTGSEADLTVDMQRTTGSIGGDFTIRGTGENGDTEVIIDDFDVAIGGSVVFDQPWNLFEGFDGSRSTAELTNFVGTVGGDFGTTGPQVDFSLENNNGGLLDITGNMDFSAEVESVLNLTFTGSDLNVGQDFIGVRGTTSSTIQRFTEAEVTIGGDYLIGNDPSFDSAASLSSFTADQSNFTIGGSFDTGLGGGSANTVTLTEVVMDLGGDFIVAGSRRPGAPEGGAGGSVASLNIADSTIEADGSFYSVLGGSSLTAIDIATSTIDFGGDFIVEIGRPADDAPELGGTSTQVVTMSGNTFKANHATFRGFGDQNSTTYSMDNIVLDLAGNLLFSDPNAGGDMTLFMEAISGNIGGSFIVEGINGSVGSGEGSELGITDFVVVDFTADIGEDLHLNLPSLDGQVSLSFANVDSTIGRDLIFDLPTDADGDRTVTFVDVDLDVQRDVVIGVGTDFAVDAPLTDLGSSTEALSTNLLPTMIGGALRIQGSLDADGDFSRDSDLVIEDTGMFLANDAGTTELNFAAIAFTGSASVDGTLAIDRTDTGVPTMGSSDLIISADGGATGAFSSILGADLGDGSALAITYDPDGVRATRALLGDANLDGTVNETDFLALQSTFGGAGVWIEGNFDQSDAIVDQADLDLLISNFADAGTTSQTATLGGLVLEYNPEDGTLTLIGDAQLSLLSLLTEDGTLDGDEAGNEGFDELLVSSANRTAYASADGFVDVQGQTLLSTTFAGDIDDLSLLYGIDGQSQLFTGSVVLIPEPSSLALLGLGGLATMRRRRANDAA